MEGCWGDEAEGEIIKGTLCTRCNPEVGGEMVVMVVCVVGDVCVDGRNNRGNFPAVLKT